MTVKELYEKVNNGTIVSDISIQREIVYDTYKQALVIDSIVNGIPLPAFYLWKNDNGIMEVLDGKQRVEAIRKFMQNYLKYNGDIWKEKSPEFQEKFSNTELTIIVCSGSEHLKREIFRRINTLGVPLSEYEVLNGLFHGEYLRGLTEFTKQDKNVQKIFSENSRGKVQYRILKMILTKRGIKPTRDNINDYVEERQDKSFVEDQHYITKNLRFIKNIFSKYSHLDILFELSIEYAKDEVLWKNKKEEINKRIGLFFKSTDAKIIINKKKEVENIIQAVVHNISVDPKRLFTSDDKQELLRKAECHNGKYQCALCGQWFYPEELQVDHKTPWSLGGRTVLSNAQLLCAPCNIKKSNLQIDYDNVPSNNSRQPEI